MAFIPSESSGITLVRSIQLRSSQGRCSFFTHARKTLLENFVEKFGDIANISESKLVNILFYGNETFNADINATILKNTIIFLKESERFDIPLIENDN